MHAPQHKRRHGLGKNREGARGNILAVNGSRVGAAHGHPEWLSCAQNDLVAEIRECDEALELVKAIRTTTQHAEGEIDFRACRLGEDRRHLPKLRRGRRHLTLGALLALRIAARLLTGPLDNLRARARRKTLGELRLDLVDILGLGIERQ